MRRLDPTLAAAYAEMVTDRMNQGWSCVLLTFTFRQMTGGAAQIQDRMRSEVERVYATLVTRLFRRPRQVRTIGLLPIFLGALDDPVYKSSKQVSSNWSTNLGLHVHVLLLVPPKTRLKTDIEGTASSWAPKPAGRPPPSPTPGSRRPSSTAPTH